MEEEWVERLRGQFPVTSKAAFFDISYENCGALYMEQAFEAYLRDKADLYPGMAKNGGGGKGNTVSVIADTRAKLAGFLHTASAKNIAFTANVCQAISLAVSGLTYQPGDNIVVGGMEHVSVLMPCLNLKRQGVECKIVGSGSDLLVTADDLLAAVDAHTRAVVVSYVQSCSGYRIDLKKLTEECHRRNILVVTDAIQALGLIPVDVQKLGVDALAASGYKGMLAAEGMGVLYCSDAFLEQLTPVFAGYNAAMTLDRNTYEICCTDPLDARKLEAGTVPFSSIYMMNAGLDQIQTIGMERIAAHISECFEMTQRGLCALGCRLAPALSKEERCASFLVCTPDESKVARAFEERGVYLSAGKPGYIRVSVAPFTNKTDIERLLAAAEECLPDSAKNYV